MVRMERLELSRLSALVPKTSMSTNSITSACDLLCTFYKVHSQLGVARKSMYMCILSIKLKSNYYRRFEHVQ